MPRADIASPVHGCAEQCIKLMCKYYGIQADEDTILRELRPGGKGEASMADISRCIKKLGLDCYGFRGTHEDLFALAHPAILYLKENADDTIGHFAVSMFDAAEDKLTGYDPTMPGVIRQQNRYPQKNSPVFKGVYFAGDHSDKNPLDRKGRRRCLCHRGAGEAYTSSRLIAAYLRNDGCGLFTYTCAESPATRRSIVAQVEYLCACHSIPLTGRPSRSRPGRRRCLSGARCRTWACGRKCKPRSPPARRPSTVCTYSRQYSCA